MWKQAGKIVFLRVPRQAGFRSFGIVSVGVPRGTATFGAICTGPVVPATLACFAPLRPIEDPMESNMLQQQLTDLTAREDALRGYL